MLLDTQWKNLSGTAAGTTVLIDHNSFFKRVIFPGTATGTAIFYDTSEAAGSAASNLILTVDQNLVGTAGGMPFSFDIDARVREGLTAVVGGTVDMTIIWG